MPNPLYIYIKYMISKQILKITFLNKPELHFFFCTQLNGFTQLQTIQFSISTIFCLHTVLFQTIQFSLLTNLNGSKYCYVSLRILLNISHLFTHS